MEAFIELFSITSRNIDGDGDTKEDLQVMYVVCMYIDVCGCVVLVSVLVCVHFLIGVLDRYSSVVSAFRFLCNNNAWVSAQLVS